MEDATRSMSSKDKPKMIWAKHGLSAVPVNTEALDFLNSHEDGDKFLLEGRNPRNLEHLQLFWALMDLVAKNDDSYPNRYRVRWDIFALLEERAKSKGYFMETWTDRWGKQCQQPMSIAFESMGQHEFNVVFNQCVDVVCEWLDTKPQEIKDEVYAIIDPVKGYTGRR